MKHLIFLSFIVFLFFTQAFSQEHFTDALKTESEGYFVHPVFTSKGIVVSDNFASKLYLIKNNEIQELISSPGCGRYFSISPDKTKICFKLIKPDGMQVPAIYDLSTMKITELSVPVDLCGQVNISNNGKIAYTIGNELTVIQNNVAKNFHLGYYSNIAPISPDGNHIIFNNNNDQLFVIDLTTEVIHQITDNVQGYAFPQWSPDGSKIAYSSLPGTIMVFDITTQQTFSIGSGENIVWSPDSKHIYYDVISSDNFAFKGSDIYKSTFDGSAITQLTNYTETNEMFPCIGPNNKIVFSTYNKREVILASLNTGKTAIQYQTRLAKATSPFVFNQTEVNNFSQKKTKSIIMVPGDVPYVNQVYDTPDWHYGYGSCAPTTAAMALAYYNRLPHWDITCSSPSSHTSSYGSYVADKYRLNEIYYSTVDQTGGGEDAWGGYGYMWGNGSPYSYMATYIQNHNVTSVESDATTFAQVTAEIDQGYPFPICNLLSSAGHLTLAVGYVVGQHTLIFNDPYGDKNTGTWPNYTGKNSYYDWPGYNNGYQNLNTMAWTVTSESSEPAYNDTIIDDVFYNHGFYIYNQSLALMRYYRDSKTGGYNNHYWWTLTSSSTTTDTCYVTWTPIIPTTGNYEVSAYIPSAGATAIAARYKIFYDGGNTTSVINQASHSGQWISLGTFEFAQGSAGHVQLGDAAGYQSQQIAFDAIKWSYIPDVEANFTSGNHQICSGDNVSFTNSSLHASSYLWLLPGSNIGISTQINPLATYNSPGTYDATLIAYENSYTDTITMNDYVVVNARPEANFNSSTTTIQLPNAIALFNNNSLNANTYYWNFGDGTSSIDQNPYHIYTVAGNYTVILIASNGLCPNDTLTFTNYITVLNASGMPEIFNQQLSFTQHDEFLWINTGNIPLSNVKIQISDELGQNILTTFYKSLNGTEKIKIPDVQGIFFATLSSEEKVIAKLKYIVVK
jgi:PKD repeat protein/Tol biopolymer transport system component